MAIQTQNPFDNKVIKSFTAPELPFGGTKTSGYGR